MDDLLAFWATEFGQITGALAVLGYMVLQVALFTKLWRWYRRTL